jgi:hypothetical protein
MTKLWPSTALWPALSTSSRINTSVLLRTVAVAPRSPRDHRMAPACAEPSLRTARSTSTRRLRCSSRPLSARKALQSCLYGLRDELDHHPGAGWQWLPHHLRRTQPHTNLCRSAAIWRYHSCIQAQRHDVLPKAPPKDHLPGPILDSSALEEDPARRRAPLLPTNQVREGTHGL